MTERNTVTGVQIHFTGHPFIDVGLATIVAFNQLRQRQALSLAELDEDDLRAMAYYLKDVYTRYPPVQNFISVIFTNSSFVQHSMTLEAKENYADEMLFAFTQDHLAEVGETHCTFFPELTAIGNAHRQHIPLLNGAEITNFSAMGSLGIPISGLALLAIHAMPLGCLKCGQLLAFHQLSRPDETAAGKMNIVLAQRALQKNIEAISLMSEGSKEGSMPSFGSYYKTRYVAEILNARAEIRDKEANTNNVTGYYFTNYGPGPNIEIVRLDNSVMDFVNAAQLDVGGAWRSVVHSGWRTPKGEENAIITTETIETWRNEFYERLFDLPFNIRQFVRYLIKGHNWQLIELFLRKVLYMDKERIETYRILGDRLGHYVLHYENQPISFYYDFSRAKDYTRLRRIIQNAAEKMLKSRSNDPLFTYDDFILAFEHPSDSYSQWRLARDLIAFRLLEILQQQQVDVSELELDFEDDLEVEQE